MYHLNCSSGIRVAPVVKNPSTNSGDTRDAGSVSGWGRSPGEGNDYPLQYACLETVTDRGAWWAIVHGVTKSDTRVHTHTTRVQGHQVYLHCCKQHHHPPLGLSHLPELKLRT